MKGRRSFLLAGAFAALLLVIGVASFAIWHNARAAQERVAGLHASHLRTGAALADIRTNVYFIGLLTRDLLLDNDPGHLEQYVRQLRSTYERSVDDLRVLDSSGSDEQHHTALKGLRESFESYWDRTEAVMSWGPEQKQRLQTEMLRSRVRRRDEVVGLTDQLERLIAENYSRERQRLTAADADFRRSLGLTTAIALLLGFAIGAATLFRMLALERQSRVAEAQLRLLSGQLRLAQEQERKFLSRELHDEVGQQLTALRMELASIARQHGDAESELSARIARAKGTVENALRSIRNIAMLLRPSMLDNLGLTPALAWLTKEISRSSGIPIRDEVDPSVDLLPDAHRTCIYRMTQEALTNAARHSGAGEIEFTLAATDSWVIGAISDNGRGFDMTQPKRAGLGLLGMEERVRELGGALHVTSSPGRGTRLEFRLPRPSGREEGADADSDRGRSRDRAHGIETSA